MSSKQLAQRALLYRRPSEPQTIEIAFDGSVYPVRLRRHRQARRYTLRIQATTREVILTIPPRGTVKEAAAFAQKHGGWVAARLGRLPEAAPFAEGLLLPLRGVPNRITHRGRARGTVWAEVASNGEQLLCVAGQAPHIDRRIGDFLRREAKRDLQAASRRYRGALQTGHGDGVGVDRPGKERCAGQLHDQSDAARAALDSDGVRRRNLQSHAPAGTSDYWHPDRGIQRFEAARRGEGLEAHDPVRTLGRASRGQRDLPF